LLRLSKSNQRAIVTRVKRLSGIAEKLSDYVSVKSRSLESIHHRIRQKVAQLFSGG
jgi:hypothetical protein